MKKRDRAEGEQEDWKCDVPSQFLTCKPDRNTAVSTDAKGCSLCPSGYKIEL